jgi:catechol 2,3-dioxygenase-like lactoylglutathione lyase family enzyme
LAPAELKPRLNFVTLGVKDVAAARAFYERLGLTSLAMGNEHVAFFDINGVVLALFGHDALAHDAGLGQHAATDFRGVSLAWNGHSEAEVDAIMAHALHCGARLVKTPQKVFWGGYSGYFTDPDGHLWEVAHNPFVAIDDQGHIKLP